MSDENYAVCEGGLYGETRLIRVVGNGLAHVDLSNIAASMVDTMSTGLTGLADVTELARTPLEDGAIFAVSTALDTTLAGLHLLPRLLPGALYHVLSRQEFNDKIGAAISGAVRRGHAYLPRPANDLGLLTSFMRCLSHETVHLSAAIVVGVEPSEKGGVRSDYIRDGLTVIQDGNHFTGLNEAVTDRAGEVICSMVYGILGVANSPDEAAELMQGVVSVYRTHQAVVDGVCRLVYPESDGADGWTRLFEDYWGGTNSWLSLVSEKWPAAYVMLHQMDETELSAEFALRFLGLKR